MHKLTLALLLAVVPITLAPAVIGAATAQAAPTASELDDLTGMSAIVADTLAIAKTGDLVAAEKRIGDFETAWDQAAGTMQPKSPAKWGAVDRAADVAIEGLRAPNPSQSTVEVALGGLLAALDNPGAGAAVGVPVAAAVAKGAFSVTNADGSPLPCEVALKTLRDASGISKPTDQSKFDDLQAKGIERCNADDDKRSDAFFADAYALLAQ